MPADHWTSKYLGMTHRPGEFDCAHFVEQVLIEQFNIRLTLPQHARGRRALDAQICALRDQVAEPTAMPKEGDCVLMRVPGRRAAGNHIGIYAAPGGRQSVLHLIQHAGSCLHRLIDLSRVNLEVEGFYRWHAA